MDLNTIPSTILAIAGSSMVGFGVGQLGYQFMPAFDIAETAMSKDTATDTKSLVLIGKAAANLVARLSLEVVAVSKVSELVMPYLQGTDPTNGGAALVSMMHSDPSLMHDFRVLSTLVHKLMSSGVSLGWIEEQLEKRETIITQFTDELSKVSDAMAAL